MIIGIKQAFAQFTTTTADTLVASVVSDVGDILVSGLGVVLTLIAALIGLFFVVRFVMRKIGRAK